MSLLLLQREFRAWLQFGGEAFKDRLGPGAKAGLAVYENNYRSQLIACLEHSFPVTLQWVGSEAFLAAASAHVAAIAPDSWTIDAYAQRFPATLADLYPDDVDVPELAWLELALGEAFVASDERALAPGDFENVDWDEAKLQFCHSMLLHEARSNAGAIWTALNEGDVPPPAAAVTPGSHLLVWRSDFSSRFRTIDAEESRSIQRVRQGSTFAELCAELVDAHGEGEAVARAGHMLGSWVADGLICGLSARLTNQSCSEARSERRKTECAPRHGSGGSGRR